MNRHGDEAIMRGEGSFPTNYAYGEDQGADGERRAMAGSAEGKPRILLMGMQRSGKSSIQKVVFHKMPPNETLYLESTAKIIKDDVSSTSFIQFDIWDLPGQLDFIDADIDGEAIFGGCGALIFVIDAQDHYQDALTRLKATTVKAHRINPDIKFEIFIHKVDGLSDDSKMDTQREIYQRSNDDLLEAHLDVQYSYYLTSIYDHSIFEAFSKVVQKLIPNLSGLENLLNIFIQNSAIDKAFLFDVVSKIYVATDSSPVDMQSYELCCDMIDVVIDISFIYGTAMGKHSPGEDANKVAFDKDSTAVMKLHNRTVLYLKEVNQYLALICILRDEAYEQISVINYNFKVFREGAQALFDLKSFQPLASSPDAAKVHANGIRH